MIFKPFSAKLVDTMLPDDAYLKLSVRDTNRLLALLGADGETFLIINDGVNKEYVRAYNQCDVVLLERGIDGTTPAKFPRGTCVVADTPGPAVKWLICNYDCCADGDCPCDPVTAAGATIPEATTGYPWAGTFVFTGDLTSMNIAISGVPSWATPTLGANYVSITGTPNAAGTFALVATATNCDGRYLATQTATLTISDPVVASPATARASMKISVADSADLFQPTASQTNDADETVAETKPKAKRATKKKVED